MRENHYLRILQLLVATLFQQCCEMARLGAVVVVKWSACSFSTKTIRVRIPLKPTVFSVKFVFEMNEDLLKEAAVGHFLVRKSFFDFRQFIYNLPNNLKHLPRCRNFAKSGHTCSQLCFYYVYLMMGSDLRR